MTKFPDALKTKPAFKTVIPFLLGLILNYFLKINPTVLFLFLILFTLISIVIFNFKVKIINLFFIISLILGGAFRLSLTTETLNPNAILNFADTNKRIIIIGRVDGYPHQKQNSIECDFEVDSVYADDGAFKSNGRILLRIKDMDYRPRYGDRLKIFEKIRLASSERNPGEFNYQKFLAANGISGLIYLSKKERLTVLEPSRSHSVEGFFIDIKAAISQKLDILYSGQQRALIKGLLLGERGEISYDIRESFARCGVIHALAISGLHVGYILIIFFAFFGFFRVPNRTKAVLVIAGIIFYNMLIGFKPPIARASLMAIIFIIARLRQRPVDILNILSAAALLILLINPVELFQASFQLSFAAILSIIYVYQKLKNFFEKKRFFIKLTASKFGEYTVTLFLVSLAAQLGTLPIVVYYFNRIPVISLITNLLVIPIVGLTIAYGFVSLIFAFILLPIAELFALTNMLFLTILIKIIHLASQFRFAAFDMFAVGAGVILIYYFFLWIFLNLNKKRFQKLAIFGFLITANIFIWKSVLFHKQYLEIIYFDVGQGDAALVKFPDGENLLIDAGPSLYGFDAGKYFLVPYFKRNRISKLDHVVLTHADNDHIGGMPSVFRNIKISQLYDTGLYHQSRICSTYQFLVDSLSLNYHKITTPENLIRSRAFGAYFLYPNRLSMELYPKDVNNNSIVFMLIYGNHRFLFTGDIEKEAEEILLDYGDCLKADVLKIAHHGSKTSSMEKLLKIIKPDYAVIAVGKHNRFKFPSPEILQRLKKFKIATIRTDLNGAIIFRTDGKKLERIR